MPRTGRDQGATSGTPVRPGDIEIPENRKTKDEKTPSSVKKKVCSEFVLMYDVQMCNNLKCSINKGGKGRISLKRCHLHFDEFFSYKTLGHWTFPVIKPATRFPPSGWSDAIGLPGVGSFMKLHRGGLGCFGMPMPGIFLKHVGISK